jgi:hypothetical protein
MTANRMPGSAHLIAVASASQVFGRRDCVERDMDRSRDLVFMSQPISGAGHKAHTP